MIFIYLLYKCIIREVWRCFKIKKEDIIKHLLQGEYFKIRHSWTPSHIVANDIVSKQVGY